MNESQGKRLLGPSSWMLKCDRLDAEVCPVGLDTWLGQNAETILSALNSRIVMQPVGRESFVAVLPQASSLVPLLLAFIHLS